MPLSRAALEPVLLLALLDGVGPSRLASLVARYGSAERVLAAPRRDLELLPGIGAAVAARIAGAGTRERAAARRAMERLDAVAAVALTPDDPEYPDGFRLLPDAPYLLFACGDPSLMRAPAVAVVGTRTPTDYGRRTTRALAGALARAGYGVVSGMARGIDTAAHAAALAEDGATIGVLGHGIDQHYPPENRALFEEVRQRGLLLTEFVPGETPRAGNFPRRNRLIVALSQAVLVVEMGLRSGAQHTVTYALEQGREVMAVPGPIDSAASEGTNQLIRDGARVVTGAMDVVEELRGVGTREISALRPAASGSASAQQAPQPVLPLLSSTESRVLGALAAAEPRHVDALCSSTELPPGPLLSTLFELELKGLAESLPGKHYRRV